MAKVLRTLSEADEAALKELLDAYRGRGLNTRGRSPGYPLDDGSAPEVYVAKTPTGGIPALDEPGVGTGTSAEGAVPGSAECVVYRVLGLPDSPVLYEITGVSRVVYNLANAAVGGDRLVHVFRDKWGQWWVAGGLADDDGCTGTQGTTGTGADSCCRTVLGGRPISAIAGYRSGAVQLLGHDADGCLEWFDVESC
jgi:hypothetical protein